MKVTILDPSCLTWPYTKKLCEALGRQGCDVELIANRFLYADEEQPTTFRKVEHFYQKTFRIYRGKTDGTLRQYVKGAEHVVDMMRLPDLIKRLKPDVIHYQQAPIPWFDRFFVPALKKLAPTVSTVHNTVPFHGDGPWFLQKGFRSFVSQFDHLIVHAEHSRRQLTDALKIRDTGITILHHPLFDQYGSFPAPVVSQHGKPFATQDEFVILFFGNISHYKGLDVLIRALRFVPDSLLSRSRLLIAGNPQIPIKPLQKLAVKQGVDHRITWELGYVPEERIKSIFTQANLVALPYRHIDGSGVFATALYYGKPMVASNIGSFGEIIQEGIHGCLSKPENPAHLGSKLTWMLRDIKRLTAMNQSVEKLRDSWPSWDDMAIKTVEIYKTLRRR